MGKPVIVGEVAREAARTAMEEAARNMEADYSDFDWQALSEHFQRVIDAERERCAKVAEDTWASDIPMSEWENPNLLCDFIAAAIRADTLAGERGAG